MPGRLPKLDARLEAIAGMVRQGVCCADIGTDHGYLIAWLAASGKITRGFACDINQKPLEKAAFSLSEYGVTDQVRLILCDGLSGLRPGDAQDLVVAGMGGDLIWEIISAQPWTRDSALRFLLQPMTKAEHLRRSLCAGGFEILGEEAVVSGSFPYTVMQAAYTGNCREIDLFYAYTGELARAHTAQAGQYLAKQARLVREKVDGLARAARPGPALREYQALLERLEAQCKMIPAERNGYDDGTACI